MGALVTLVLFGATMTFATGVLVRDLASPLLALERHADLHSHSRSQLYEGMDDSDLPMQWNTAVAVRRPSPPLPPPARTLS